MLQCWKRKITQVLCPQSLQAFLLLTSRRVFLLSSPPLRVAKQHSHETLVDSVTQWRIHNILTTHLARMPTSIGLKCHNEAAFSGGFINTVLDSFVEHKREIRPSQVLRVMAKTFALRKRLRCKTANVSTNACCPPIPQMTCRSNDQFRTSCECYIRYLQ